MLKQYESAYMHLLLNDWNFDGNKCKQVIYDIWYKDGQEMENLAYYFTQRNITVHNS